MKPEGAAEEATPVKPRLTHNLSQCGRHGALGQVDNDGPSSPALEDLAHEHEPAPAMLADRQQEPLARRGQLGGHGRSRAEQQRSETDDVFVGVIAGLWGLVDGFWELSKPETMAPAHAACDRLNVEPARPGTGMW